MAGPGCRVKAHFSRPPARVSNAHAGFGWFGRPAERQRAAIARDLLDGYVSSDGVRRDYGIADPEALREAARQQED